MFYQAVQISTDGENWTTLFNTDAEDKGGIKQLGTNPEGKFDEMFNESADGNSIVFETTPVRYIRFWSGGYMWSDGRAGGNQPLWVQLEAFHNTEVTFDPGYEGGENWTVSVPVGTTVPQPEMPVHPEQGYVFEGWMLNGEPYDFQQEVDGPITLTASWKKVSVYELTLQYHDGVTEPQVIYVTEGSTPEMPENPVQDGYHFAGWKLDGAPYNPTLPVTENMTLDACWVTAQADDAVRISAGQVDYYLSSKGQITNIVSKQDGIDYVPEGHQDSNLVSLIANGEHHVPSHMSYEDGVLYFEFASINAQVEVCLEQKGAYTTFTVENVIVPPNVSLETLLWGPIKTTISEVVGESLGVAYNHEFALGIHDLNDKTIGGWPQEWTEITYPPGYPNQDNTYLSGMSWQSQAAVVAPAKTESNPNASGWGGSFLQSFTNQYTQPTEHVVAGYPWVRNDKVDQSNPSFDSYTIVANEQVPALTNSAYPENGSVVGSSIALFGCKARNILNTVEEIELGEDLPHPTINGEWQKKVPAVLFSEITASGINTGSVERITQAASEAGIPYVYDMVGAVGPWDSNGSYRFNSSWGHSDYNAMTQMCEVAAQFGVNLGVHSMSDYVASGWGNDPLYVTNYGAHPDLAYAQTTVLTRPVSKNDKTIYIANGRNFDRISDAPGTKYVRIGSEIIEYSSVEKISNTEWRLSGCTRGVRGTGNYISDYEAGASAARLWLSVYGAFLGGISLQKEIAERQAQAFNNSGVHSMSCDGLEDAFKNGYNQLAMNEYASTLYENCTSRDGFVFVNSMMAANQWDMLSYESWNRSVRENLPNFNKSAPSDQADPVTDSRAEMMQRNLFPLLYNVSTGDMQSLNTDLSLVVALDGGFKMGDVSGLSSEARASIKAWKDAATAHAFSEQQKQDFLNAFDADKNTSWRITTVIEGEEWTIQKTDASGNPIGEPFTVKAGGKLHVADCENGNVATSVSIENVTGINPDYTNKIKMAFAGSVAFAAQPDETVLVSPQADAGYTLASLKVLDSQGNEVALTEREEGYGNYEFVMPEGDVTIQPEFVKDSKYAGDVTIMGTPEKEPEGEFAISVSDKVENGTVTVDNMAKAGSLVTITAEPAEGYRFMQASVICENNEAVIVESKDGKAQFIMPECPVTIMAWFVPLHSITAVQAENGSLKVDVSNAAAGDAVVVSYQADSGYKLVPGSLIVRDEAGNGIPMTVTADTNRYEFVMPDSKVEITAKFEQAESRMVNTRGGSKGTVEVSSQSAYVGDLVTFTVNAAEGCTVNSVYVLDNSGNQAAKMVDSSDFAFNSNRVAEEGSTTVSGSFIMPDGDVTVYAYFDGETGSVLEHGLEIGEMTASTTLNDASSAEKAHDHDENTAWKSNTVQGVTWDSNIHLDVQLKEIACVSEIKLIPYELSGDEMIVSCILKDADGNTLAVSEEQRKYAGEIFTFTFENIENVASVEVRPQEIKGHAPNHLGISEIEIYGTTEPPVQPDKTLLQKTYDYALTLSTDGVTDSAKAYFEKVLSEAKAVLENSAATQEEVNTAWDNLLEGIWGLGFVQGDKTMLEQEIAKAEAMIVNQDKYVQDNWQQLVDALEAAKKVMADGDAMEEDVQPAAEALLDAILAQRYKADKSILEELIKEAEETELNGYTAESVAVFMAALQNAKAVLADEGLSEDDQGVVDEAVKDLKAAIKNLSAEDGNSDSSKPDDDKDDGNTDNGTSSGSSDKDDSNNSSTDKAPTTGDNTVIWIWVVTASVSLILAALVMKLRRRETF